MALFCYAVNETILQRFRQNSALIWTILEIAMYKMSTTLFKQ